MSDQNSNEHKDKDIVDVLTNPNKKNPVIFIAIPAILILLIIAFFSGESDNTPNTTSTTTPLNERNTQSPYENAPMYIGNQNEQKEQEAKEEETFHSLGESVKKGDLSFIIEDFIETNNFNGHTTTNKYVVISATVTNIGNEPVNIDHDYFVLFDDKERKHDSSNSILIFGEDYFSYDKINPGLSMSGKVAFEVPADSINFILALNDNLFTFGKPKYEYVKLEKDE